MKRGNIIALAFVAYLVAMVAMFFGVNSYITSKDIRLRDEIYEAISNAFEGRKEVIGLTYSGYRVEYDKMNIPLSPAQLAKKIDKSEIAQLPDSLESTLKSIADDPEKEWKEDYGDLYKMYQLRWNDNIRKEDGWCLSVCKQEIDGVSMSYIFPYAVGYKKQEWSDFYSYAPSVQAAVNEAFDFFTNNNKSQYYGIYEKNSVDDLWSKLNAASNEYYFLAKDETPRMWGGSSSTRIDPEIKDKNGREVCPYKNGSMYNGYYRVFIGRTQPTTYSIKKYDWEPDEKDRKDLWLYWSIGLTVLLLLVVIPLWVIDAKHQKVKDESLYDKLKRMCNPTNFMNGANYDKEKVDRANAIYKRLLEINGDDVEALNELQQQAVAELGINLIDAEKLADLKEKVNPKNYMTPYNPDKVALANELYAILSKEGLTYNEMADVEEKSKQL